MAGARSRVSIGASNCRTAKVHERKTANILSEWTGSSFRRRRIEGRDLATVMIESTGDVICVDRMLPYNIECKKGKTFSYTALVSSPTTCQFTAWWHQASYDAKILSDTRKCRTYPILFFKPTHNVNWVATPSSLMQNLCCGPPRFSCLYYNYSNLPEISLPVGHSNNKSNKEIVPLLLESVYMTSWEIFSSHIDPKLFMAQ